mgnify:FL=1
MPGLYRHVSLLVVEHVVVKYELFHNKVTIIRCKGLQRIYEEKEKGKIQVVHKS